jgi:hypothetical protein
LRPKIGQIENGASIASTELPVTRHQARSRAAPRPTSEWPPSKPSRPHALSGGASLAAGTPAPGPPQRVRFSPPARAQGRGVDGPSFAPKTASKGDAVIRRVVAVCRRKTVAALVGVPNRSFFRSWGPRLP